MLLAGTVAMQGCVTTHIHMQVCVCCDKW